MLKKLALIGTISALALGVAGCDDDDPAPVAAPAPFLSGTAATGAPIAGGAVTVNCAGTTTDLPATTSATGTYSISTADATAANAVLPCSVRVTLGSTTLFSLVTTGSTANVTPLTNLAVERALGLSGVSGGAAAWFTAGGDLTSVTTANINAARTAIENALMAATGESSVPFNIFSTAFDANPATSVYDQWLEAFNDALTSAGVTYSSLITSFRTGGTFPASIDITLPTTGGAGTNLSITMSVLGVPSGVPINVAGVPNPGSQAIFCAGNTYISQAAALGSGFAVTSCTYNPATNSGTMSGTVSQPGMPFPVSFSLTYTWS